jgi:drug/metabolite transporter (DMT)-like permease
MKIPRLLHADLWLVLITLIWGSSFLIVKKSLAQVSPILFIALRFWVGAIVVTACMPGALRDINLKTVKRGLNLSVLLLGGFVFQTIGLRGTTSSRSAFITSLAVLLVPILGYFVFHHRPRFRTLIGVVLATVGLGMLTLNTIPMRFTYGDGLTFICAIVFALHILFIGRYLPESDYRQLAIVQLAGSAVLCTLVFLLLETPFLVPDITFGLYLLVIGVLATGLAFYVQVKAQQVTTPNRTALIFSLEPFFAALVAYLVLGETLSIKGWAGGVFVVGGILISEFRRK